jgi:hypothetical protein
MKMAKKQQSAYNISAPQVIAPASPYNPITDLVGYIVETPGTSGAIVFNDCATLAQASPANQIISIPFVGDAIGTINSLDLPITNGLVISQVPTGMTLAVQYNEYVPG